MEFSNRDDANPIAILKSQSGQGVVEYVMVLIVGLAIIFGGIYRLSDGFKKWGENYFGNYIACLLETGELPIISGGGTGGVCESQFEPFTLAKGRPGIPSSGNKGVSAGGAGPDGPGSGGREGQLSPSGRTPAGGGGGGTSFKNFGSKHAGGSDGKSVNKMQLDSANTGDTSVQRSGGYSGLNRRLDTRVRHRLDNSSVMEANQEENQKKKIASGSKTTKAGDRGKKRILLNGKSFKKAYIAEESEPMNFGDYIRILIIAAIVIALVMFLGGQLMQISKNME